MSEDVQGVVVVAKAINEDNKELEIVSGGR
jgi:hypothetical protein